MDAHRGAVTLFAVLICVGHQYAAFGQQTAIDADPIEKSLAGYPVVQARRFAISPMPFDRPLDAEMINKWMEISSQCTIAEFELFLGPLAPQEAKLLDKIEHTPPPIVNRLHFEHLRGVIKNGGLFSLTLEDKSADKPFQHTTPAVENELFGAFECVFASVGPPDGSPRYGDVIIRLEDSARETGWATPFSGMHFIYSIRHQDARKMQGLLAGGKPLPTEPTNPLSLGFDDRLHYSHYIVTEKHWHKALAYQAVLVLRNLDDSPASDRVRRRMRQMLETTDKNEFWSLFIPPRKEGLSAEDEAARIPFGYLEAKFPDTLPIKFVTSIEVPADRLDEVRAWPESRPYLKLIRAKPLGVD